MRLSQLKTTIVDDYFAMHQVLPRFRSIPMAILNSPGFSCVFIYRVQQYFYLNNRHFISGLWSRFNHFINGAEICLGANIGKRLIIRHPTGIVIGIRASIGDDCVILHNVTIGEKNVDSKSDGLYPVLLDRVVIGAGSMILGGVTIGNDVTIGAMTLVLTDISDSVLVYGNPLQIRKKS